MLEAVKKLNEEGYKINVYNIVCLKPLSEKEIKKICSETSNIIVVEEHNVIGGLGSSIADVIATNGCNAKLTKIGIEDCFAKGYGTHKEVKELNHLSTKDIYNKIKKQLKKEN